MRKKLAIATLASILIASPAMAMKPILDREITLYTKYLKQNPVDTLKAVALLRAVYELKDSPFPIRMTVNVFRSLVGCPSPHPDDRGEADLLDPDEVRKGDDVPTKQQLIEMKQLLELNNAGPAARGELSKQLPELYDATK